MARPRKTVPSTGSAPPTREIGAVLNANFSPAGMAPWNQFWVDYDEFIPELTWPRSIQTYKVMRTDSQLSALYTATLLGMSRMNWAIDPNGADDSIVNKIARDYNLTIVGDDLTQKSRGRLKRRFSFRDHMRKAFKAGIWGHYYFEQVGFIGDGQQGRPNDGLWHLRKLAERPPSTIADFRVSNDGGLVSILQNVVKPDQSSWQQPMPEIPVDNLVGYVWDQEGANWAGRSWFRDVYKNWVIKDRLLRIDAVNHERAGGVPYIEAHPGATHDEIDALNKMAQSFRIGDTAGGAVPAGAKFNVARGTNSSVIDSITYHDESMARRFMLMVMQLGQTRTGSRALGSTFSEFWASGLEAIAYWFADTFNEHVIEDDVDWNWGEDVEQVPLLVFDYNPALVISDLVSLITCGAIIVDTELENEIRKELGLPEATTPHPVYVPETTTGRPAPPAAPGGAAPTSGSTTTPAPTTKPSGTATATPAKSAGGS
jgi:hypothetical protein